MPKRTHKFLLKIKKKKKKKLPNRENPYNLVMEQKKTVFEPNVKMAEKKNLDTFFFFLEISGYNF